MKWDFFFLESTFSLPDFFSFSLPAKSTKFNLVITFCEPLELSSSIVKMACDLELFWLRFVAHVALLFEPSITNSRALTAEETLQTIWRSKK